LPYVARMAGDAPADPMARLCICRCSCTFDVPFNDDDNDEDEDEDEDDDDDDDDEDDDEDDEVIAEDGTAVPLEEPVVVVPVVAAPLRSM